MSHSSTLSHIWSLVPPSAWLFAAMLGIAAPTAFPAAAPTPAGGGCWSSGADQVLLGASCLVQGAIIH